MKDRETFPAPSERGAAPLDEHGDERSDEHAGFQPLQSGAPLLWQRGISCPRSRTSCFQPLHSGAPLLCPSHNSRTTLEHHNDT